MEISFCIKRVSNPKKILQFLFQLVQDEWTGKKKKRKCINDFKKGKKKIKEFLYHLFYTQKRINQLGASYLYWSPWGNDCALERGCVLCKTSSPATTGKPVIGLNSPLKLVVGVETLRFIKPVLLEWRELLGDKFTCSKARNWSSEG